VVLHHIDDDYDNDNDNDRDIDSDSEASSAFGGDDRVLSGFGEASLGLVLALTQRMSSG